MTMVPSLRRVAVMAALAVIAGCAAAPLAGAAGWASAACAAGPHGIGSAPTHVAGPAAIDPAPTVVRHGPRTERVVALTFDDGWNPTTLRQIYRVLVRERVPATFFVTGIYVQRAPALWRAIAAAGFPLANHSYLHRDTRTLAPLEVVRDLALTRQVVEKATGRAMLPYYRPPYGARNTETDRLAAAAGFPAIVLWDTTAADATPRQTVAGVVRDATAGRPGSIVLLHAGPVVTPRALPAIIAAYRARGFRFVTLPELLGTPRDGWGPGGAPARVLRPATTRPARYEGPSGPVEMGTGRGPGPAAVPVEMGTGRGPGPAAVPVEMGTGRGLALARDERGESGLPAHPARSAAPESRARDEAWARRDQAHPAIAAFTVAILLVLVAVAAVAGRGRPEDDAAG